MPDRRCGRSSPGCRSSESLRVQATAIESTIEYVPLSGAVIDRVGAIVSTRKVTDAMDMVVRHVVGFDIDRVGQVRQRG